MIRSVEWYKLKHKLARQFAFELAGFKMPIHQCLHTNHTTYNNYCKVKTVSSSVVKLKESGDEKMRFIQQKHWK